MACGRCRQLLWENGRPDTLVKTPEGVLPLREVLPQAFGPQDLVDRAEDQSPERRSHEQDRTFHG
jgi:cytidine deaminase